MRQFAVSVAISPAVNEMTSAAGWYAMHAHKPAAGLGSSVSLIVLLVAHLGPRAGSPVPKCGNLPLPSPVLGLARRSTLGPGSTPFPVLHRVQVKADRASHEPRDAWLPYKPFGINNFKCRWARNRAKNEWREKQDFSSIDAAGRGPYALGAEPFGRESHEYFDRDRLAANRLRHRPALPAHYAAQGNVGRLVWRWRPAGFARQNARHGRSFRGRAQRAGCRKHPSAQL